jgi:amidohydrolase
VISELQAARDVALRDIDLMKDRLVEISRFIHDNPELGRREFKAAQILISELEKHGFKVEKGIAGMETAFSATLEGKPGGPTIALLAEYDALPDIGHACGHNMIAAISIGAGIGLKNVMGNLPGKLIVLGTPDEEGSGGKINMIHEGIFNVVDAAMMFHPSSKTKVGYASLALQQVDIRFQGKPAHAATGPEKGINALNAVIQTFNGIDALRQHVRSDVRIHGIITEGGSDPCIVPENAAARFLVRAADSQYMKTVVEKVEHCAEGAALSTGAKLDFIVNPQKMYEEMKTNTTLARVLERTLTMLGEEVAEGEEKEALASTDMGNVSHVVPSVAADISIGPKNLVEHSHEFVDAAVSEVGNRALITAAKALALACIDLFTNAKLMEEVKAEFEMQQ